MPYSRVSHGEHKQMPSYWLLQPGYNPEKDQIKVLTGKSLFSDVQLQYTDQYVDLELTTEDLEITLLNEIIPVKWKLRQLAGLIEHSKHMLSLEPGWDEENAQPIDPEIWKAAVKFLMLYATEILEDSERILELPEINPCKDGTVDLSWRTSRARLLINLRKSEDVILAFYYGDFYKNVRPIKGWVNTDNVDLYLSMWMRNLAE
ncbi:MAG: hypothetical protein JXA23_01355 [Bacteroidales bacterium]|nr:hypothetical protein [Bacteroidales bacterium]